jgi:hypothetical protein
MATTRTSSKSPRKTAGSKTSASRSAGSKTTASKSDRSVKRFDGRSTKQPPAFAFLMEQHREVEGFFEQFEKARSDEQKSQLARQICLALKVHAQIEEELVYSAAHDQLPEEDLVDEAIVEHASAKDLIARIEAMEVGEHLFEARVKVLGEYVRHHVQEEEKELFPEIQKNTQMDLVSLGEQLQRRAEELKAQLAAEPRSRAGKPGDRGLASQVLS